MRDLLGVNVNVRVGLGDHSWPIRNAFEEVWPGCRFITCYPHAHRNLTKSEATAKLVDKAYAEKVKDCVAKLHLCATQEQFDGLAKIVHEEMVADGEGAFADHFRKTYLTAPWNTWFAGASGIVAFPPNNNNQESGWKVKKKVHGPLVPQRAGLDVFITQDGKEGRPRLGIHHLVQADTENISAGGRVLRAWPVSKGAPSELYDKAQDFVEHSDIAMLKVPAGKAGIRAGYYVNSATFLGSEFVTTKVTLARVKEYNDGLNGKIDMRLSFAEASDKYQSLHLVYEKNDGTVTCTCKQAMYYSVRKD